MGVERKSIPQIERTEQGGPNHLTTVFGEESPNNHRAGDVFDSKIIVARQSKRNEAWACDARFSSC